MKWTHSQKHKTYQASGNTKTKQNKAKPKATQKSQGQFYQTKQALN